MVLLLPGLFCPASAVLPASGGKRGGISGAFFERITREQTMPGTRGSIYDRNGELLAYNELVYSVAIEDSGSYGTRAERNQALNETIRIQNGYQRQAYK